LRERSPLIDAFRDMDERTPEDYLLYFGIINSARRQLEEKYPGIQFHVLVWDRPDDPEAFTKGWQSQDLDIHHMNRVLPGLVDDDPSLYLAPDPHPTSATQGLVADYVITEILGSQTR